MATSRSNFINQFLESLTAEEQAVWSKTSPQLKRQILARLNAARLSGNSDAILEGLRKTLSKKARLETSIKFGLPAGESAESSFLGLPSGQRALPSGQRALPQGSSALPEGFLEERLSLPSPRRVEGPGVFVPNSFFPDAEGIAANIPDSDRVLKELIEGSPKAGGAGGGGGVPPTPPTSAAGAAAEGASEAAKAGESLAEAAGLAKAGKAATVAEKAAEAASFWSKTGKLLGKGLHIGGALLTPLMLLDIGLRIAEESGADVYGKKARERKIFGEDIASAMDRKSLENLDRFNETSTIPQITQMVRGITPMGQALGISQANADQSFSNYMNNKQMRLSQLSQPMGQQPSIEEMALRLGLPT